MYIIQKNIQVEVNLKYTIQKFYKRYKLNEQTIELFENASKMFKN